MGWIRFRHAVDLLLREALLSKLSEESDEAIGVDGIENLTEVAGENDVVRPDGPNGLGELSDRDLRRGEHHGNCELKVGAELRG